LGSAWTTFKVLPISSFRFETEQHLTPVKNTSSKKFLFRSDSIFDGNLIGNSDMRYVCLKSEIMSVMFC
jgi:hypothetical protein